MGIFDIFTNDAAQQAAQAQIGGIQSGYNQLSNLYGQGANALTQNYTAGLQPFLQNYGTATAGTTALAHAGGQLIAVLGRMSADDARQLAASRRGNAPAMALLFTVSSWPTDVIPDDTARTGQILAAAGWRVTTMHADTPLELAWQQLHRPFAPFEPADRPLPVGGPGGEPR